MKNAKKVQKVDLGAIFDAHVRHEFVDHDVAATMKTMAAEPYVHNVPTLTGGDGHAGVVEFYTHPFVGKLPADTRIERVSRTVGRDQVADELILYFTHDCPIDYMLPGIPPDRAKGRFARGDEVPKSAGGNSVAGRAGASFDRTACCTHPSAATRLR